MPPLRDRKEDIPLFARHFLKDLAATYGRRPREITDDAVEALMRYSWPGNVRELRNVIERIVIMNPMTTRFDRKHLPPLVYRDGHRRAARSEFSTLHQARDAYERDFILKKLDENHGNITRAAEVLGLERSHLYRKMKTLGITVKRVGVASRGRIGMLALYHADFSAVLSELHFIHQLIDQKDSTPMIGINIFSDGASGDAFGFKTSTRIAHHNEYAALLVSAHQALHCLGVIFFSAVNHGVRQRLL